MEEPREGTIQHRVLQVLRANVGVFLGADDVILKAGISGAYLNPAFIEVRLDNAVHQLRLRGHNIERMREKGKPAIFRLVEEPSSDLTALLGQIASLVCSVEAKKALLVQRYRLAHESPDPDYVTSLATVGELFQRVVRLGGRRLRFPKTGLAIGKNGWERWQSRTGLTADQVANSLSAAVLLTTLKRRAPILIEELQAEDDHLSPVAQEAEGDIAEITRQRQQTKEEVSRLWRALTEAGRET